jgi:hypothetical protein
MTPEIEKSVIFPGTLDLRVPPPLPISQIDTPEALP